MNEILLILILCIYFVCIILQSKSIYTNFSYIYLHEKELLKQKKIILETETIAKKNQVQLENLSKKIDRFFTNQDKLDDM
jgi:hypothetical protein